MGLLLLSILSDFFFKQNLSYCEHQDSSRDTSEKRPSFDWETSAFPKSNCKVSDSVWMQPAIFKQEIYRRGELQQGREHNWFWSQLSFKQMFVYAQSLCT